MTKKSLRQKIILPAVVILAVLVIVMTVYSLLVFREYTGILFNERITVTANGLKRYLADCEQDSRIAAVSAATNAEIIESIQKRDSGRIISVLTGLLDLYHVDNFTVTDAAGRTLARTHAPENFESALDMVNIREALNGVVYTCIEQGAVSLVSVRTGAPVYDTNGVMIGVISTGIQLDTNEAVDNLKAHFDADFGVFVGNTRVATTITRNGERITGTPIDPAAVRIALEEGRENFGELDVFGENYSAFYLPLKNYRGEVFAVLFAGVSNEELLRTRNELLTNAALIGLVGLIVSVFILFLIVEKITRPLNHLVGLVSEVTHGNMDVNIDRSYITDDETGALARDIYLLVGVIKSTLNDLSRVTKDLIVFGDIHHTVNTENYSGSYKEIMEGIKTLADSVSMMKKTMAVMDYLDTMISVVDLDYNLLYINHSLAETFDVDIKNYQNKKCYNLIRNLDEPCSFCQLSEILPEKDMYSVRTYHDAWDSCKNMWIGGRVAAINWIDGSKVYLHSFSDESQKKNHEMQLKSAMQKAEAASVAKTSFLANMSHEIRTPMNSILGFSELALDIKDPSKSREYLGLIIENSQWLMQIINDILDISKIESGNMELEFIPFDLHELFVSCKTLMTPKATEKNIELYFYAEPFIGKMLVGDPTRLRQVLTNLLSNAVKFTNVGTVKLFAAVKQFGDDEVTLRFEVKDSGIGMTREQINKVFDPFTQADVSMTRRYGGTGLGLTITKNLIELMGGTLGVESAAGVGSKFSFELTFGAIEIPAELVQKNIESELERPLFEGEILVCEDNKMNQMVISEHLARVGLKADIAENGLEGIDKIKERVKKGEKPFDLIFMDIHMPVMDGIEAVPKIIQLDTGTPIVAMTANIMSGDKEHYRALGMDDHIGKPFTSQELWRCLLKYLKPLGFADAKETEQEKREKEEFQAILETDFAKTNETKFEEITGAIDSGDLTLAHRLAHTLKSTAALIGKTQLKNAAADIEAALKNGKNTSTQAEIHALKTELRRALDELRSQGETASPSGAGEPSGAEDLAPEKARELLEKLEPLLQSGSPESLNFSADLRLIPGSGELIRQIENFSFGEAEITLLELKNKMEDKKWRQQ